MGCGASAKRQVGHPGTQVQQFLPQEVQIEEACRTQVGCKALAAELAPLDLQAFAPRLRALGVQRLGDIVDLLVSDLEEVGLKRVQIRQLQRAAGATQPQGGDSATTAGPTSATSIDLDARAATPMSVTSVSAGGQKDDAPVTSTSDALRSAAGLEPVERPGPTPAQQEPAASAGQGTSRAAPTGSSTATPQQQWPRRLPGAGDGGGGSSSAMPHTRSSPKAKTPEGTPRYAPVPHADAVPGVVGYGDGESTFEFDVTLMSGDGLDPSQTLLPEDARRLQGKEGGSVAPAWSAAREERQAGGEATNVESFVPSETNTSDSEAGHSPPRPKQSWKPPRPTPARPPRAPVAVHHTPVVAEEPMVEEPAPTIRSPPPSTASAVDATLLAGDAAALARAEPEPSTAQMPEALRRRLDQRAQDRADSRSKLLQPPPGSGDPPVQSPSAGRGSAKGHPSPSQLGRRSASVEPSSAAARDLGRGVEGRSVSVGPPGEKCGRQMFDKNALRAIHRSPFEEAVTRYRKMFEGGHHPATGSSSVPEVDLSVCTLRPGQGAVQVFVRKRPLFAKEQQGNYDVVTVVPGSPLSTKLVLHNCQFQADLKTPFVNHLHFDFDHAFGELAKDQEVYRVAAAALVVSAREGNAGTLFMFGQTGSGKTHTMTAIEAFAAENLFEGAGLNAKSWLSVEFVELRGNRCFDLLADGPKDKRPEVKLRENQDGGGGGFFGTEGAVVLCPASPSELCALMKVAHARRATSSTGANDVSSRSHALCTVRMSKSKGRLTLADCAGTERRKDSMYHSKERQQEGAEINASLHALKECVRYASCGQKVPAHVYRQSSLTKMLAGAFTRGDTSRVAVICTVSPCSSDTEHTLATLRTGISLGGSGAEREEKEPLPRIGPQKPIGPDAVGAHPKQWSPERVSSWLSEGHFADVKEALPSNFTGQMLVRLSEARCAQLCKGDKHRGQRLFDALHEEMRLAEQARKPTMPY